MPPRLLSELVILLCHASVATAAFLSREMVSPPAASEAIQKHTGMKLITTPSSATSNPGDKKTNQRYTAIMDRLQTKLNPIQTSTREITDAELQGKIRGPGDGELLPVHSDSFLHLMRVNSLRAERWKQRWAERYDVSDDTGGEDFFGGGGFAKQKIPDCPPYPVGRSAFIDGKQTEKAARQAAAAVLDVAKDAWTTPNVIPFVLAKPPTHHCCGNEMLVRFPKDNGRFNPMLRPRDDAFQVQSDLATETLREEERVVEESSARPFGFCHLNGVAAAAGLLLGQDGGPERIAILDFDVHPGNGNEDTFYHDERVLTVSVHQRNVWPYDSEEVRGYRQSSLEELDVHNLNVEISVKRREEEGKPEEGEKDEETDDQRYKEAFLESVFPRLEEFNPDFLFICAGFDAMAGDGYADMGLTAEWFGWVGKELRERYSGMGVPMVWNLEGGYNVENVEQGVRRVVEAFE